MKDFIKNVSKNVIRNFYKFAVNTKYLKYVDYEYYKKIKNNKIFYLCLHVPCRLFLGVITLPFLGFLLFHDLALIFASPINKREKRDLIKKKKKPVKIHLFYFTSTLNFDLLLCSLKSLKKTKPKNIGNIYVFVDKKKEYSITQMGKIKSIFPKIIIKKTKYRHVEPFRILNEICAFAETQKEITPDEYLYKLDDDVLFISKKIFNDVIASNQNLVGKKTNVWPKNESYFQQGGSYFMKSKIIPEIVSNRLFKIYMKNSKLRNNRPLLKGGEDGILFLLAKKHTKNIKFIDFYYPIEKIEKFKDISSSDKKKYSIIHFKGELKNIMLPVARKIFKKI